MVVSASVLKKLPTDEGSGGDNDSIHEDDDNLMILLFDKARSVTHVTKIFTIKFRPIYKAQA